MEIRNCESETARLDSCADEWCVIVVALQSSLCMGRSICMVQEHYIHLLHGEKGPNEKCWGIEVITGSDSYIGLVFDRISDISRLCLPYCCNKGASLHTAVCETNLMQLQFLMCWGKCLLVPILILRTLVFICCMQSVPPTSLLSSAHCFSGSSLQSKRWRDQYELKIVMQNQSNLFQPLKNYSLSSLSCWVFIFVA